VSPEQGEVAEERQQDPTRWREEYEQSVEEEGRESYGSIINDIKTIL
jgi:hypothetical protein